MHGTDSLKASREALLFELTQIPTAAGHEDRVIAFVDAWIATRADRLHAVRDDVGNILVWQKRRPAGTVPLLFTAHLDHPAFVVTGVASDGTVALEFRGGVNDPYFEGAEIELIGPAMSCARATITTLDAAAKPFKTVTARLDPADRPAWLAAGIIARWHFPRAEAIDGCIHTDACDDLAAAAAALAAFGELLDAPGCGHVGLLFTVAEEVGFLGTIHAARNGFVPRDARLLCLENSRSFPHDSPIGAGAILRVGDRISVFTPELTNRLAELYGDAAKKDPAFRWQRKLMPGGACEATAFASYGYRSTCLCLPLGNYHNMADIDGVAAGARPARVAREFVSLADFHSLVEMLHLAARGLDDSPAETTEQLMERLYAERRMVLERRRIVGDA
jgi:endoglucanase